MNARDIKTAAVIGAGQMGQGIAQVFAAHGIVTHVFDNNGTATEAALQQIQTRLQRQANKSSDSNAAAQVAETMARLQTQHTLGAWLGECDLVLEAVSENESIKTTLLAEIEPHLPTAAIIASNTSSYPITQLARALSHPQRFIGMHFMNPAPAMQLVEIIRGEQTDDATNNRITALVARINKTPVHAQDTAGFIANRILFPMLNEAIIAVEAGTGSITDIDTAMTIGMNHPMGPLTLADFIGLDSCLSILNTLHAGLQHPRFAPAPLLQKMVAAGELGKKTKLGFYDYQQTPPTPHTAILS